MIWSWNGVVFIRSILLILDSTFARGNAVKVTEFPQKIAIIFLWSKIFHCQWQTLDQFQYRLPPKIIWGKAFKNGPSIICRRQPLKNLKLYGLFKHLQVLLHLFSNTSPHIIPLHNRNPYEGLQSLTRFYTNITFIDGLVWSFREIIKNEGGESKAIF